MDHQSPVGGGDAPDDPRVPGRLDSWKEIAAHFRRDARTVRRWERTEGLPVHRHLHHVRGSVYAFPDELDRWWESRSAAQAARPRVPVRAWLPVVAAGSVGIAALAFVLYGASVVPQPAVRADSPGAREASTVWSARWPKDPQVRDAFLIARHQLSQRTGHRRQAREHLEFVVGREPGFAEAHALLGEAYLRQALYDAGTRAEAWPKAEASARRALALDDHLASAHTVLGRILLLRDWDWTTAEAEIARAIELAPDDLDARSTHAFYLRAAGRLDDALAERQRVQRAEPLNPYWLVALGNEFSFARRYEEAHRSFQRALELERDNRPAVAGLADVSARTGRVAETAAWQIRYLRLTGRDDLAAAYDEACRRDGPVAAERWLDQQRLKEYSRDPEQHPWNLAYTHARLGERDEALRFLELAYERRDTGLLQARVDPDVDLLRGDPRFHDVLRRIGPPR